MATRIYKDQFPEYLNKTDAIKDKTKIRKVLMSQLSEIKGGLDCHEHEHAHPKQIQREKKYMAFVIHMLNGNMDKAEKKKNKLKKYLPSS
jgi:ppGpp synthetase/RelA/SpoT-type nucleotidyltranferase